MIFVPTAGVPMFGLTRKGESMPRPEKVQAVADIRERIDAAKAVFLAEYAGLSVQDQQTLRRSLRQSGAEFRVVKMTLARLAVADLDIDSLDELLLGPTGLAFANDDAVMAAKAIRDFAKDHEVFTIKGGLLGREFLTPERINELAEIESRDSTCPLANGMLVSTVNQGILKKSSMGSPQSQRLKSITPASVPLLIIRLAG